MLTKFAFSLAFVVGFSLTCIGQEKQEVKKPVELDVLKASVGVWDAEVEVWPRGLDAPSTKFTGVETNRAFGEHWIASDSDYGGMKLHAIIGYDLDTKKMKGTVVDHGPYSASMEGEYDEESKTIHWVTKAKDVDGTPMIQKTSITQKDPNERVLVLSVPGEKEGEIVKFMQIKFVNTQ